MRIEVIAIASEILSGQVLNTNATFISQKLRDKGYLTYKHIVIGDNEECIKEGILKALEKSDLIIVSGGLGPTLDDITKRSVSDLFHSSLIFDEVVAKDLRTRFQDISLLEEQMMVPDKAEIMRNHIGTASGFIFSERNKHVLLLPGVPHELQAMFVESALPHIEKHFPLDEPIYSLNLSVSLLSEPKIDQVLRKIQMMNETVQIGIYPRLNLIDVTLTAKKKEDLEPLAQELKKELKTYLFEEETIERALHEELILSGETLAVAESCSGGRIASRITQMPDCSKYFLGSIVSYSNEMKERALGVEIGKDGAVSESVVLQMIKGIDEMTNADFSAAVSGIAGPNGAEKEKPVGTVWIAFKAGGKIYTGKMQFSGDRNSIIEMTANFVFASIYRLIKYQAEPEF